MYEHLMVYFSFSYTLELNVDLGLLSIIYCLIIVMIIVMLKVNSTYDASQLLKELQLNHIQNHFDTSFHDQQFLYVQQKYVIFST